MEVESPPFLVTAGISEATKSYIRNYIREVLNPSVEEESLGLGVAKLFDDGKEVGTFTFLGKDFGTTCFHAVYTVKDCKIKQDSLYIKIKGDAVKLKHIVSYPYFDISIYKLDGASSSQYFEIRFESIHAGDKVTLIAFPALEEAECDLHAPVYFHGKVSQTTSSVHNKFLLADYECLSCCSGGAVVNSQTGMLVGIHISSNFYEDSEYECTIRSRSPDYLEKCGAVWSLQWQPSEDIDLELSSESSQNDSSQGDSSGSDPQSQDENSEVYISEGFEALSKSISDVRTIAMYSASNTNHKGNLGCFLPAVYLHQLVPSEIWSNHLEKDTKKREQFEIADKHRRKRTFGRMYQSNFAADKKWAKRMRKVHKCVQRIKGRCSWKQR